MYFLTNGGGGEKDQLDGVLVVRFNTELFAFGLIFWFTFPTFPPLEL